MDSSKILIIGSKGQLGLALQEKYPNAMAFDSDKLDITDQNSLREFDWSNVEVIINAAAYTNVDGAETPEGRRLAWAINAEGAANLAGVANKNDFTLVHISTDYVFDGTIDNHLETEGLSPLSVYGASKAGGDIAVSSVKKHYLLRTSWVIGDGNNFVRTMINLANKNVPPTVVNDQVGRLTFTSELVRAIDHLLVNRSEFGTYNISNSGSPANWAEITREVFSQLGRNDLSVAETTTAEYFEGKTAVAPRPLRSTLDLEKIENTGFLTREWKENLKEYINNQQPSHLEAEGGSEEKRSENV